MVASSPTAAASQHGWPGCVQKQRPRADPTSLHAMARHLQGCALLQASLLSQVCLCNTCLAGCTPPVVGASSDTCCANELTEHACLALAKSNNGCAADAARQGACLPCMPCCANMYIASSRSSSSTAPERMCLLHLPVGTSSSMSNKQLLWPIRHELTGCLYILAASRLVANLLPCCAERSRHGQTR